MCVAYEGFQRGDVLGAEFIGQRRDGILFAVFGAVGGLDQAIGDTAHGGDNHYDRVLGGGGMNDARDAADAVGVADGGAAEFHDLERGFHCFGQAFHFRIARGCVATVKRRCVT